MDGRARDGRARDGRPRTSMDGHAHRWTVACVMLMDGGVMLMDGDERDGRWRAWWTVV